MLSKKTEPPQRVMSIDTDNLTPGAIRGSGARIVTYGAPVHPGNMLVVAYLDATVLVGGLCDVF